MNDTITKLQQLQDILGRKYEVERELFDIPRKLETQSELLNRLKVGYLERNEQNEALQKEIRELRRELEATAREREVEERKMDDIKTQREYEALDREIQDAVRREQEFLKKVKRDEALLEESNETLNKEEALIKTQEEELGEEKIRVEAESKIKEKELNELIKEEKALVPGMDEELLFKFDRILRNKNSLGIVSVSNSICNGCHMILPSQFVIEVREGKDVHFCPYCSRVLFYEEGKEDIDQAFIEATIDNETLGALSDILDDDPGFEGFDNFDD